jgi:hypothetical protein
MHHSEHIVARMSHPSKRPPVPSEAALETLRAGLVIFAAVDIGLALFMAVAPHTFYTAIGPFGASNAHYVRDVATFYAAVGIALAVSVSRPSWRVPVLAISTIQFALHSLNHLIDITKAHPAWAGYTDFFSLLAGTAILAWLWRIAWAAENGEPMRPVSLPLPTTQRSPT